MSTPRLHVITLSLLALFVPPSLHASIDYAKSLSHWSKSCEKLKRQKKKHWPFAPNLQTSWQIVCNQYALTQPTTNQEAQLFFKTHFKPFDSRQNDVLITGYYAPVINACWTRQPGCTAPIYATPRLPELLAFSRQTINSLPTSTVGRVIAWVDPIDRYFLQIQGSGELQFRSGDRLFLGFAAKNKHPYSSIGRYLIKQSYIDKSQLSMQGIQAYLRTHPNQRETILEQNASFVYFKEKKDASVRGKLGSPLAEELSAAVDNKQIPMGSLIEVHTHNPIDHQPWHMLLTAQDTGSAIRGNRHIDVYMGTGKKAEQWAGQMHQNGILRFYIPKTPFDRMLEE